MTTINPISMTTSTPIKFDQMPPPDSSSAVASSSMHTNSTTTITHDINLNSNNHNLKPIKPAMVQSPHKPNQVNIAAKPANTNTPPLLAAKPILPNSTTNKNMTSNTNKNNNKNVCPKQANLQQQQLLAQQQQQQQQQTQFQQQIQQLLAQQQQRAIYLNSNLNGNLNLNSLIKSNPQAAQQLMAEALKQQQQQQAIKNPSILPAVNSQIQLNNQQLLQLLATNSTANNQAKTTQPILYAQQQHQQSQQQQLNKLPILNAQQQQQLIAACGIKNEPKLAPAPPTANSAVPQSATIISATTTPDGQIIFQTVPAAQAAAALAAYQNQNNSSNNSTNNSMPQNAQAYLTQLLAQQQQQQQQHQQQNAQAFQSIAPKITDNPLLNQQIQQEQLKQKLLMEEQKFLHLQQQLEQQQKNQLIMKQSTSVSNLSPNKSNTTTTMNEIRNKSPVHDVHKSPDSSIIKCERKSLGQGNETSEDNEIDLTNEMETNEHDNSHHEQTQHQQKQSNPTNIDCITPNQIQNIDKTKSTNNSTNGSSKRRGRPRLYAVNPMTGKSMKGRLLSSSPTSLSNPKASKSPKLFPNTNATTTTTANNSTFNPIILNSNAGLIPIPIQLQPNGIAIYAASNPNHQQQQMSVNSNQLFFTNTINNSNETNQINENIKQEEHIEEEETPNSNENTENDQDNSLSEPSSNKEPIQLTTTLINEIKTETETVTHTKNEETNNNQLNYVNNNKMSPVSEISQSISQFKPYRLSPSTMTSQVTLTHIIDGFVIKESSKPFPVKPTKIDLYIDQSNLEPEQEYSEQIPKQLFKCAECGSECTDDLIEEKYCSLNCKEFTLKNENESVEKTPQKIKKHSLDNKTVKLSNETPKKQPNQTANQSISVQQQPQSQPQPLFNISNNLNFTNSELQYPSGDPTEWNCDEVYQFVKIVSGVQVAELFKAQEVDGSALSLIRDDHLVNTMQIKLGPALKIMSRFNDLRSKFNTIKQ